MYVQQFSIKVCVQSLILNGPRRLYYNCIVVLDAVHIH
jgi:hypothetical protein